MQIGARDDLQEKWEMLLGIRLLGATFWWELPNHQAATARMHWMEKHIVECRPLLEALLLSLNLPDVIAPRHAAQVHARSVSEPSVDYRGVSNTRLAP